jgi:hypothetical protein
MQVRAFPFRALALALALPACVETRGPPRAPMEAKREARPPDADGCPATIRRERRGATTADDWSEVWPILDPTIPPAMHGVTTEPSPTRCRGCDTAPFVEVPAETRVIGAIYKRDDRRLAVLFMGAYGRECAAPVEVSAEHVEDQALVHLTFAASVCALGRATSRTQRHEWFVEPSTGDVLLEVASESEEGRPRVEIVRRERVVSVRGAGCDAYFELP